MMTRKLPLARPGPTAIAAVLALSAAPLLAQTMPADPVPPPIIQMTPPVVTAPTMADPAPGPIVVPVPPIIMSPPVVSAPEPAKKTQNKADSPAPAASAKPAPRDISAPSDTKVKPALPDRLADLPAATPDSTASEATIFTAEPMTSPGSVHATDAAATDIPEWAWVGGGLAAILLIGGAGAAWARRKRPEADAEDSSIVPAFDEVPAMPRTSFNAPMINASSVAAIPVGAGRHVALAMMGPTPDNPFLTRRNRLKRARFYDRRERIAADVERAARHANSVWAQPATNPDAPAAQPQRDPQPVQTQHSTGISTLKPGFAKG